jgi:hypothetical protein
MTTMRARMRERKAGGDGLSAVSEAIGVLVLVGMVVIGVALVWLLIFSNPPPSKVPVLDTIISNRSRTIYILHKGGDPLRAGEYRILVDGGDQTANFSIASPGAEPWSVGETLVGIAPSMPGHVVLVFNETGGSAAVLGIQDLVGTRNIVAPSDAVWYQFPSTGKCLWQARKSITIDGSKVTATLSSFPVLVSITDSALAASAQAGGADILFTASDGSTKLDHEIENFTPATGSLTAWVRVPTLASGTNTVIYMYYGNSTVGSQQNPTGVWNDGGLNYFKGVWHLHNNTGVSVLDSTTYANTGTPRNNSVQTGGQIDGSLTFVSSSYQHVTVPADADLQMWDDMTISGWMKTGTTDAQSRLIAAKWKTGGSNRKNYWFGKLYGFGTNHFLAFQINVNEYILGPWNLADNNWHYVAGVSNKSNLKLYLYVDGVQINNSAYSGGSTTGGEDLNIGKSPDDGFQLWNGALDEIHLSRVSRSSAWIAAEYANQNSPSTFYSVGSEEQGYWKC